MNNILTIDTSSDYLSLAISNNQHIFNFQEKVGNRQSQEILPQINNLLTQANLTPNNINKIAYNQGSGTFTGLRIGLSIALGLAYSSKSKLIPVSTFAMYAQSSKINQYPILVVLDARLNQIYVALINPNDFSYYKKPSLILPEELDKWLSTDNFTTTQIYVTGNGWEVYANKIPTTCKQKLQYVQQDYPPPNTILELVQTEHFTPCDIFDADLLYVRNKVAMNIEEQLKSKHQ